MPPGRDFPEWTGDLRRLSMRIADLRRVVQDDRVSVRASVRWEDCDQPDREVFIATDAAYGEDLSCSPHAFLIGCLVPAIHFGEARIRLDAEVCPSLLEGLQTAMSLLEYWYGDRYRPIRLDVRPAREGLARARPPRAGLFLSGGVDSLAALRLNHLHYPPSHPGFVRDCLILHGFDVGGVVEKGPKYHVFDRARAAMENVAAEAGVELIPVYTNIRHLCDERELWLEKLFGAVLAAVAHAFAGRLDLVYVASSYDLPNLGPCGSHPLLDPEYSSWDLRIRHRDAELSRLEKLRIVADWPVGFQNLRACLQNVPDRLNCGWCEKCVRTMVGLVALGVLQETRAYVEDDVSAELLEKKEIAINHRDPFYRELISPLRERGREDLVRTIERKLSLSPPSPEPRRKEGRP